MDKSLILLYLFAGIMELCLTLLYDSQVASYMDIDVSGSFHGVRGRSVVTLGDDSGRHRRI